MKNPTVIDRLGNNAAIACPDCNGVFIVSRPPIYKKPRVCPHCGKAQAKMTELNIITVEPVPYVED